MMQMIYFRLHGKRAGKQGDTWSHGLYVVDAPALLASASHACISMAHLASISIIRLISLADTKTNAYASTRREHRKCPSRSGRSARRNPR